MKNKLDQIKKSIPEADGKNPTVIFLLELLEQQVESILRFQEENQLLKNEIARLKNHKPKPKIIPVKLAKKIKANSSRKRPGSTKRSKKASLKIHKTKRIPPRAIPAVFTVKGLKPYTVQGLRISVRNTLYQLEQCQIPEGKITSGELSPAIEGHFGPSLRSYIFYQYHYCHVPSLFYWNSTENGGGTSHPVSSTICSPKVTNPSMTKKTASWRPA